MRALRDKLWAKLTALVLFVLLGFLALLRTAQLFSNYMSGDEVGGSVLFIAVCAAGCLVCLVFSLSSAGHWAEHEGIYLTWLDRIPLDVLFLVPLCMWMEASWATVGLYWLSSIVYWAALLCVTALFAVSFAARCKAGDLWRNTLIWRTVRVTGRAARSVWRGMRQLVRGLPLVWRTALVLGAVLIVNLWAVSYSGDGMLLLIVLLVNGAVILAALLLALDLRRLQEAGEKLARGDYAGSPALSRWALPDLRAHADHLGSVGAGVQRAVEERMKSEHLKTELITNVSHDIKTPITSIVNYVDLLKKEPLPEGPAREYVAVLDRQSQRLKKLTEDLVEASKAATGNIPVVLEPTDLHLLLGQVVGEYAPRLAECALEPVMDFCEDSPVIQADGRLLWRVLDNLMGNICKYALPGTRVYLTTAEAGGMVHLTVKNISRYPLNISGQELTERFVRGDASRSTEGSGLGLSIAQSLTQLQKGLFEIVIDGDLFKAHLTFPPAAEGSK